MKKSFWFIVFIIPLLLLFSLLLVSCTDDNNPVDEGIKVTFDTDGGSVMKALSLNEGDLIQMKESTFKDGYNFVTWLLGDYEFDFNTPITSSIELKAVWVKEIDEDTEAICYFDTGGGTYIAPIVIEIGSELTEPTSPVKEGYSFKYWVDEFDENRVFFPYEVLEETYFSAYYEARKKVTINFNSDGGTEVPSTFIYAGDKIGELPTTEKDGYLFVGWIVNGSLVDSNLMPTLSTTLKAKFVELGDGYKYVSFIDYDGSLIENQKVEMGKGAVAPTVNRTGYTFIEWDKDFSFIYEDIECKAIYEINKYNVEFLYGKDNKESTKYIVEYMESPLAPIANDYDDMVFCGWDKEFKDISSDLVIRAIYKDKNGLTNQDKIEHTINKLNSEYDGDASGDSLTLGGGESEYGTSVIWTTSNKDVITADGVITKAYVPQTVTMKAIVSAGNESKNVYYDYVVPRTTMDLSRGVSGAYLYSDFKGDMNLLLSTYDVYFLAFANFSANGNVTGLGEMGSFIVNNYKEELHARGAYLVPSFRTTEIFAAVAVKEESRVRFAESIVEMINKYDLDGVDIDWEYPKDTEQSKGYVALMKEIYTKVKANNPKHIVTSAILIGALDYFRMSESIKYMDYANMMSYEMHSTSKATHHTALYTGTGAPLAISNSLSRFTGNGIPLNKIIIGCGFFGRQFTGSKGLGTAATYVETALSYSRIKELADNPTETRKRYWDNTSKSPYIYDSADGFFVSYDDPESIACKFDYVVSKKLGGIMCWQTGQDNGDLTQAFKDNYYKLESIRN